MENGEVRVFISSTFRDMQEERNYLVNKVFLEMRKICEERDIVWGEVDLRWGIPEEEEQNAKILSYCFNEIDRCRPFFIGIIGEKYGTTLSQIKTEEFGSEYIFDPACSITEMEILNGPFNKEKKTDYAFFYFRDPAYLDTLPVNVRENYVESSMDARRKLTDLKERIKKNFPVRIFKTPKELGELVAKDLTVAISSLYCERSVLDKYAKERFTHNAFAKRKSFCYVKTIEVFQELDKYIQTGGNPIIVVGPFGTGKSALLANWAWDYRKRNRNDIIISHFLENRASENSSPHILRRMIWELSKITGKVFDVDKISASNLNESLARLLKQITYKHKVILVVDGLNHMETDELAVDLSWIPEKIDGNLRIILSSTPGISADLLKNKAFRMIQMPILKFKEKQLFCNWYLDRKYGKRLSTESVNLLCKSSQTSNPLFLCTALEELRVYGNHERLVEKIREILAQSNLFQLCLYVLGRCEDEYGEILVREVMSTLALTHGGVTEREIIEMLGFPYFRVMPLLSAISHLLIGTRGYFCISNPEFLRAIETRYLSKNVEKITARSRIVNYLSKENFGDRVNEVLWQLKKMGDWDRIYRLLSNPQILIDSSGKHYKEIIRLWGLLEERNYSPVDAYQAILDDPEAYPQCRNLICQLLFERKHKDVALELAKRIVLACRNTSNSDGNKLLYNALKVYAKVLEELGRLDEAVEAIREAEQVSESRRHYAEMIGKHTRILIKLKKFNEARDLIERRLKLCSELLDDKGYQRSLSDLANAEFHCGNYPRSLELYQQSEKKALHQNDKIGLSFAIAGQAQVYMAQANSTQSREEYMRSLQLLQRQENTLCGIKDASKELSFCLGDQAKIYEILGDYESALAVCRKQETLCRSDKNGLLKSLRKQRELAEQIENWDLVSEVTAQLKQIEPGMKMIETSVIGPLAQKYRNLGFRERAMSLLEEEVRICRAAPEFKLRLAKALGGLAEVRIESGKTEEVLELLSEQKNIFNEVNDKKGLSNSLRLKAKLAAQKGDLESAWSGYQEYEIYCNEINYTKGIAQAYGGLGAIDQCRGNYEEAQEYYRREAELCQLIGDLKGEAAAIAKQVLIQRKLEDDLEILFDDPVQIHDSIKIVIDFLDKHIERLRNSTQKDDRLTIAMLYKEKAFFLEMDGDADNYISTLLTAAEIFNKINRIEEAHTSYCKALCLITEDNQNLRAKCLIGLADIAFKRGESEQALAYVREQVDIDKQFGQMSRLAAGLEIYGKALLALGDRSRLREALSVFRERENIYLDEIRRNEHFNYTGLNSSLCKQFEIQMKINECETHEILVRMEQILPYLNKKEVTRYWGYKAKYYEKRLALDEALEAYRKEEELSRASGDTQALFYSLGAQANLLRKMKRPESALVYLNLQYRLAERMGKNVNQSNLAYAIGVKAEILRELGNQDEAMALFIKQAEKYRELNDVKGIIYAFTKLSQILLTCDRLDEAWEYSSNAEEMLVLVKSEEKRLCYCKIQQVLIQQRKGNLTGALALAEELEQRCIRTGNHAGVLVSLTRQLDIVKSLDRQEKIDSILERQRKLVSLTQDKQSKLNLVKNLSGMIKELKESALHDLAIDLIRQQLVVFKEANEEVEVANCLNKIADELVKKGSNDEAMKEYEKAAAIFESEKEIRSLAQVLGQQAKILIQRKDYKPALAILSRHEELAHQLKNEKTLFFSMQNQASIYIELRELDQAELLLQDCEKICRKPTLAMERSRYFGYLAEIHRKRNNLDVAMNLYIEQEQLSKQTNNLKGVAISLANQSKILFEQGETAKALNMMIEVEQIYDSIFDSRGVFFAIGQRVKYMAKEGKLKQAWELIHKQEELCSRSNLKRGMHYVADMKAELLLAEGNREGALEVLRQWEEVAAGSDDKVFIYENLSRQIKVYNMLEDQQHVEESLRKQIRILEALGDRVKLYYAYSELIELLMTNIKENLVEIRRLLVEQEKVAHFLAKYESWRQLQAEISKRCEEA